MAARLTPMRFWGNWTRSKLLLLVVPVVCSKEYPATAYDCERGFWVGRAAVRRPSLALDKGFASRSSRAFLVWGLEKNDCNDYSIGLIYFNTDGKR